MIRCVNQCADRLLARLPEAQAAQLRAGAAWFHGRVMTWCGGLWFALGLALFALSFALIAQYGFGYQPCVLCLWQRVPYAGIIPIALLGLFVPKLRLWRGALLLTIVGLLLVEVGIAFFHAGVEQHWWLGTSGCAIQAKATDAASLRASLLSSLTASCDQISWTLFGLSMTVWNLLMALGSAFFLLIIVLFGKAETQGPYVLRYRLKD